MMVRAPHKTGLEYAKYIIVMLLAAAILFVSLREPAKYSSLDSSIMTASKPYSALDELQKEALFKKFQHDYEREYDSPEVKEQKFEKFKEFIAKLDIKNEAERMKGGTATHGITKFADMSDNEFQQIHLGFKPSEDHRGMAKKVSPPPRKTSTPTSVDWTTSATTHVKDQGYCGSCWAFSAVEQIESDAILAGVLSTNNPLSTQQIVSCDNRDLGCNGGNTETAYAYVITAGGLFQQKDYTYTAYWGNTGDCLMSSKENDIKEVTITGFNSLRAGNSELTEQAMINYVLTTGPLSVCLDASAWSSYTGGIVSVCGSDIDHCVQIVGVNEDEGYWLVRNSWGSSWGEAGYIRLALNQNTCEIAYDPTYSTIAM